MLQICEGAEPPHEKVWPVVMSSLYDHNVVLTQKVSTLASMPEYATPADARKAKEVELVKQVLVCT